MMRRIAVTALMGWGIAGPVCQGNIGRHVVIPECDKSNKASGRAAAEVLATAFVVQMESREQCPFTWRAKLGLRCPAAAVMLVTGRRLGLDLPGPLSRCAPAGCVHVPAAVESLGGGERDVDDEAMLAAALELELAQLGKMSSVTSSCGQHLEERALTFKKEEKRSQGVVNLIIREEKNERETDYPALNFFLEEAAYKGFAGKVLQKAGAALDRHQRRENVVARIRRAPGQVAEKAKNVVRFAQAIAKREVEARASVLLETHEALASKAKADLAAAGERRHSFDRHISLLQHNGAVLVEDLKRHVHMAKEERVEKEAALRSLRTERRVAAGLRKEGSQGTATAEEETAKLRARREKKRLEITVVAKRADAAEVAAAEQGGVIVRLRSLEEELRSEGTKAAAHAIDDEEKRVALENDVVRLEQESEIRAATLVEAVERATEETDAITRVEAVLDEVKEQAKTDIFVCEEANKAATSTHADELEEALDQARKKHLEDMSSLPPKVCAVPPPDEQQKTNTDLATCMAEKEDVSLHAADMAEMAEKLVADNSKLDGMCTQASFEVEAFIEKLWYCERQMASRQSNELMVWQPPSSSDDSFSTCPLPDETLCIPDLVNAHAETPD